MLSTTVERGNTESGRTVTTTVVYSRDSSTESRIWVHIETSSFSAEEIMLKQHNTTNTSRNTVIGSRIFLCKIVFLSLSVYMSVMGVLEGRVLAVQHPRCNRLRKFNYSLFPQALSREPQPSRSTILTTVTCGLSQVGLFKRSRLWESWRVSASSARQWSPFIIIVR
jgi:hypothetical protein